MKLVKVRRRHGVVEEPDGLHAVIEFQDFLFGVLGLPNAIWTITCPHGHDSEEAALACVHEFLESGTEER